MPGSAVLGNRGSADVAKENAEDHAREKHSGQAEVYAQALAAATELPVREVVFVYCKAGVEVAFRRRSAWARLILSAQ